jgi:hypothetical protein
MLSHVRSRSLRKAANQIKPGQRLRCREYGLFDSAVVLGFLERSQLVQDYLQPVGNVPQLCSIFCSHYRSMPPVAAANSEQN